MLPVLKVLDQFPIYQKRNITLMDSITIQLQKEKEDKIQEDHQKILEEDKHQLENIKVNYEGIIGK